MVPGCLSGRYERSQLTIDVAPLARAAGAELVLDAAVGWDDAHTLRLRGGGRVPYDICAIDVGSVTAAPPVSDGSARVLPVRPMGRLLDELEVTLRADRPSEQLSIAVVGGGAGGLELAFNAQARLRTLGSPGTITVLEAGSRILPERQASLSRHLTGVARRRGIRVRLNDEAVAIAHGAVELQSGERLAAQTVVWATGAEAPPLLRNSPFALSKAGFVRVRDTLQTVEHDHVFASGDCMVLDSDSDGPRAGVHAVRQGPVLARNLRAWLAGGPLVRYRRQRDFLTLLNLGDGRATAAKWGLHWTSGWIMRLKDRIDRGWIERYQV